MWEGKKELAAGGRAVLKTLVVRLPGRAHTHTLGSNVAGALQPLRV